MPTAPSTNGANGRNARGQFATGNPGGPGNPHAKKVAALRSTLMKAVTHRDMEAIVKRLIEKAKDGDVHAAREVLDRCFGKAKQSVEMDIEMESPASNGVLDFNKMSDLEIAEVIEKGGLPVPPILAKKVELIRQQAREAEQGLASTAGIQKKLPQKKGGRSRKAPAKKSG